MRNPGDKVVPNELIAWWQRKFRVLLDWEIAYEEDAGERPGVSYLNGQCDFDVKHQTGGIYPCPAGVDMDAYVLHEVIHLALHAMGSSRDREEMVVRDLVDLLMPSTSSFAEAARGEQTKG